MKELIKVAEDAIRAKQDEMKQINIAASDLQRQLTSLDEQFKQRERQVSSLQEEVNKLKKATVY